MASIRDVPTVWRKVGLWRFTKDVWFQIGDDNVLTWASALAYAWIFALFPFLIFLLTLIPYLPRDAKANAYGYIADGIKTLPAPAQQTINQNIDDLLSQPRGGLLSIGLLVALWAASGGMSMTMAALDQCYDVPREKLRPIWTQRPIAVFLTIVVVVMILLVVILLPIGGIATHLLYKYQIIFEPIFYVLSILRYLLALVLMFAILALIYHFGPSLKPRWQVVSPGAIFSIIVWIALGWGFRYYIDAVAASSYNKTYGAVGGVVILLLLFYFYALVLLVGAEINAEIDYVITGVRGNLHREIK